KRSKTYSSGDSHVVTHRSTNPPVHSLSTGERTGSSVLCDLWPYVMGIFQLFNIIRIIAYRITSGSQPVCCTCCLPHTILQTCLQSSIFFI
ncbi:hypothetical protein M433DRAFT_67868, partial [Acidomyces richmondensis BFW]